MTDLIAELDRLFAKATPGEWKGVPIRLVINGQQGPLMSHQVGSTHSPEGLHVTAGSERVADHELIAALHNAYPSLRDLLRSAEKGQADGWQDLLEAAQTFIAKCDSGQAFSKRSYAAFKNAIAKINAPEGAPK